MGIKLTFSAGFDQTLRKQRLVSLLEIGELIKANSNDLSLSISNLNQLYNAAQEIDNFYNTDTATLRQVELLTQQIESSCEVLKEKIKEGKIHKASVRSLKNTIEKLGPHINRIIAKEITKESNSLMKIKLVSNQSS